MTTKKTGRGARELKVRVKDKRKSQSSRTWLERQLNDPYVIRAKREGFRSRAAFKLIEIDDKHHLLKPGAKVADLVLAGCAILEAIRRAFPCERLRVADRGLREGMLVQMMREDGVWGDTEAPVP